MSSARTRLIAVAVLLVSALPARAADGDLDPTFAKAAIGDFFAADVVVQGDGNIVVCGTASGMILRRYGSSGAVDATFGNGGTVVTDIGGGEGNCLALAVQADGKLIAVGGGFAVARYEADGNLDPTFGNGGLVMPAVLGLASAVALQPDGKIVAVGSAITPPAFAVVRYNPDGSLDAGFGSGGIVTVDIGETDRAQAVVVQTDGRIVVAGRVDYRFALARLMSDGSLDPSFGSGGTVVSSSIVGEGDVALVLQPDAKLVVAGSGARFTLARYDPDGSLDPTFGNNGVVNSELRSSFGPQGVEYVERTDLVLEPDGQLVATASAPDTLAFNLALVRFDADGAVDGSFGACGTGVADMAGVALARQPDGKLVVAGSHVARFGTPVGPACVDAPPRGASLRVVEKIGTRSFSWRWTGIDAVATTDFGDPVADGGVALCFLDASASPLLPLVVQHAPGGTCSAEACWRSTARGFSYHRKEKDFGALGATLAAGGPGKAKLGVRGRGFLDVYFPLGTFAAPVVVRLARVDGGGCWEARFSTLADNGPGRHSGKSD